MNYSINYSIVSVSYEEATRTTTVIIVNEDSGETFYGEARRNPKDKMNIALATNLATARAVHEAVTTDLQDSEESIIEYGDELGFNN